LRRTHGAGGWRKMAGIARVRLPDDSIVLGGVHWYQAHGIGKREFKLKRILNGFDEGQA